MDFNVPLEGATITNNQRIVAALPTIKHALESKAKSIVLMSHLGRPDGKRVEKYSLALVAKELEKLLGANVTFLNDCVGLEIEERVAKASDGLFLTPYSTIFIPLLVEILGDTNLWEFVNPNRRGDSS